MSADVEFWLQQPTETPYAYEAFCCFRDLGPGRRLRRAAGIFYHREDVGPEESQRQQFKRWSSQHLWVDRAQAYDNEQAALRAAELERRRIESADQQWRLARVILNAIAGKVLMWQRDPDSVPSGQVAQLFSVATQAERLALGEPSEITQTTGDADAPRPLDFSGFTHEELDTFYGLYRRAYDAPAGSLAEGSLEPADEGPATPEGPWRPPPNDQTEGEDLPIIEVLPPDDDQDG